MVTRQQVINAQNEWVNGLIKIGSLKDNRTECEAYTNKYLDELYAFEIGPVLFKPTKCALEQFRPTKSKAISYFIAGDERECKEDWGFAITPWIKVRIENHNFLLEENRAFAMGNFYLTDSGGREIKVEYTFGYKLIEGSLKIDIHHSSLPYNP